MAATAAELGAALGLLVGKKRAARIVRRVSNWQVVGREIEKAPLTSVAFLLHEKDIPRTHVY
jgi:hypothetical protein